ncbi:MAG: sulfatase-like hydrolase/transferase [Cellulophaga sp.]
MKIVTMYKIISIIILITMFYSCDFSTKEKTKPNVIFIYTDDIGYGDIGVYGAKQIATPNIDKMAAEGIRFTDGHCAASTCSPSRYAILTGEMGFRKNVGIQPVNAPITINPKQFTLGKLFQKAGYRTGIVGKWHLGLGDGNVNWNTEIKPGPLEVGFDYSFIIPSTNDRAPFVYLENRKVYNLDLEDPITVSRRPIPDSIPGYAYPDAIRNPESITVYKGDKQHSCSVINGVGRIGYMKGGKKALWNDNTMADVLLERTKGFVKENKDHPFFLFLSTNDIHAPRLPHPRFRGSTNLGYRGDNVVQLDWYVGEVMKLLKKENIEDNTILVFTSDNGPVNIDGGYQDGADLGNHKAAGIFRGGKYQIYEGGTRVPFIVRWPLVIQPAVSNALVSQVDLLASFATLLNMEIPENAAQDSRDYWNTFIGKDTVGADIILEQTNSKKGVAIRKGNMKYLKKNDSYEMYNLENDPSEKNNIIENNPKLTKELHLILKNLLDKPLKNYN